MQMVAVQLPEPRRIHVEALEGAKPLRTLPEVELRDDEAEWATVLERERLAVVLHREQHIVVAQLVEREVRRVVMVGVHEDVLRLWPRPHTRDDLADGDALEAVVETRPASDAVDVARDLGHRKPKELVPGPRHLVLDQPEAAKRPGSRVEARRLAIREHRPLRGHALPWGNPGGDARADSFRGVGLPAVERHRWLL